jgi:GT2 family glycosyltransferase
MAQKSFQFVPESLRVYYRTLRAMGLSLTLRSRGPFALSPKERLASAAMAVVIPVHDAPEVTARCLKSLEVFGGDAEVIIVDDGSKLERTKLILDGACKQNGWKLIRNAQPSGHSRACEAGVAASSRPYICLLNSDTVMTPRSWRGVINAFETSARVAVVGPSTSYTVGPQYVQRAWHCRHYWSDQQIWQFAEEYVAQQADEVIKEVPFLGGFAFFVRRFAWDEMGGFDKNLPDYGNETELCRRFTKAGWRLLWTKAAYIHHLGSESYGRTLGAATIQERSLQAESYIQGKHEAARDTQLA